MAGRGKLTAADCNFVHVDESWKTYVRKEVVMGQRWSENWGFLQQEYRKVGLLSHTPIIVNNLREDIDSSRGLSSSHCVSARESCPLLPPLSSGPSFPLVTSREVGWRSARSELQLEVYGRWGRPKVSILRHLNWPHDAVA